MDAAQVTSLAQYISKFGGLVQDYIGKNVQVEGKRVLVVGSGWGTEMLWALKQGASEVVGLDPSPRNTLALEEALTKAGMADRVERMRMLQVTTQEAPDLGQFDYVLSCNAVEHIFGLSHTLASIKRFMPQKGGRIAIFTDPLYYCSAGSHLKELRPWEHLMLRQREILERVGKYKFGMYQTGLNGMTITDFLSAVREAGLIVLKFEIVPDRHLEQFPKVMEQIPTGIKPMDLCLEGMNCLLCFPENI